MGLYRIYIDETGNHDMSHADDPNQRFLALTGVIVESDYISKVLLPEMEEIKRQFFQSDPDEPIIFHRKELVNKKKPFQCLVDPIVEEKFNNTIIQALIRWEYIVITIVLDKKAHRDQYSVWRYHPYHYCLKVLIERYVLFLHYNDMRGDVMVESRGGHEDIQLKESYRRLYNGGTENIPVERWQARLTSSELKVKPKIANIAGLQIADLIAHPSRREILIENNLIRDDRDTFGNKICDILNDDKYYRSRNGQIIFGKKLLP